MSKSSKQITVNFPLKLLEIFFEHLQSKHLRDYVREAFAEKLSRDFGVQIEPKDINRKFGERVDLRGKSPDELKELAKRFNGKKRTQKKPAKTQN